MSTYIGWSEGTRGFVELWLPSAQVGWIVEMIAIGSQPFFIVDDTSFLWLLSNACPLYAVLSHRYFAEKVIPEIFLPSRCSWWKIFTQMAIASQKVSQQIYCMDLGCWRELVHQLDNSLHWPHYLHTRIACPSRVPLRWVTHNSCYIWNDHKTSGFLESFKDQGTHCCAWQCYQYSGRSLTMWPAINWLCDTYPSVNYQRLQIGSMFCIWHVGKMLEDCGPLYAFTFSSRKVTGHSMLT